jgi:hypothetical protein
VKAEEGSCRLFEMRCDQKQTHVGRLFYGLSLPEEPTKSRDLVFFFWGIDFGLSVQLARVLPSAISDQSFERLPNTFSDHLKYFGNATNNTLMIIATLSGTT